MKQIKNISEETVSVKDNKEIHTLQPGEEHLVKDKFRYLGDKLSYEEQVVEKPKIKHHRLDLNKDGKVDGKDVVIALKKSSKRLFKKRESKKSK